MWQGTGLTNEWNLSCYIQPPNPPNPSDFVCLFLLICSRRGGATAAVLTLDTAVDESRKIWQIVWQSPLLGFVLAQRREALSLNNPWVRFSWGLPYSVMLLFIVLLLPCSKQSSAPLQQVVRVLGSFVFCLTSRLPLFYLLLFVVFIFSVGVSVVCCALVPGAGTWHVGIWFSYDVYTYHIVPPRWKQIDVLNY